MQRALHPHDYLHPDDQQPYCYDSRIGTTGHHFRRTGPAYADANTRYCSDSGASRYCYRPETCRYFYHSGYRGRWCRFWDDDALHVV
jgi:hypothetical protein